MPRTEVIDSAWWTVHSRPEAPFPHPAVRHAVVNNKAVVEDVFMGAVRQLRLVLTVPDFDAAVAFYRDALGLDEHAAWEAQAGRIAILDAGAATLELVDEAQAEAIDEIEVGRRVAGPVRIAFAVEDSAAAGERLARAGGELVAGPVETPWHDLNVRVRAPDGMQLTLFTELGEPA